MSALKHHRRIQGFVAMPDDHPQTSRLRGLLTQIASESSDCTVTFVFAHERLTTHFLLIRNLHRLVARADFVLFATDGKHPDVSFEAGLAVGLHKPLLFVILPETRTLPATFMGHFSVELSGDESNRDRLKSALQKFVTLRSMPARAGATRALSRMRCGGGVIGSVPRLTCPRRRPIVRRT